MDKDFTKDEWLIEENTDHHPFLMGKDNNVIATFFDTRDGTLFYGRTHEETSANAKIAMQAGNIARETGLLPNELLEQRHLLKAAVINIKRALAERPAGEPDKFLQEAFDIIEEAMAATPPRKNPSRDPQKKDSD